MSSVVTSAVSSIVILFWVTERRILHHTRHLKSWLLDYSRTVRVTSHACQWWDDRNTLVPSRTNSFSPRIRLNDIQSRLPVRTSVTKLYRRTPRRKYDQLCQGRKSIRFFFSDYLIFTSRYRWSLITVKLLIVRWGLTLSWNSERLPHQALDTDHRQTHDT